MIDVLGISVCFAIAGWIAWTNHHQRQREWAAWMARRHRRALPRSDSTL